MLETVPKQQVRSIHGYFHGFTSPSVLVLQTTDSQWRIDHNDEVHLRNTLETEEERGRKPKKNTSNSSS